VPINSVLHTNRHSVDRLLGAGLPVALVFWDKKHQPNKSDDTALDTLAKKYEGKALIAKIDTQDESELMSRFSIGSVPSFAFVDHGNVIERTDVDDPAYVDAWLGHLSNGSARPSRPAATSTRTSASAGQNPGPQSSGGKPVILTDATFGSAINSPRPTLVDFWAEWCGPCRMVAPSVETLAKEFDGKATVAKLNVDQNRMTAGQYGIQSIPSLLIFKDGQVVDQIVGAQPLPVIRQKLAAQI
jgi:thioredoxin